MSASDSSNDVPVSHRNNGVNRIGTALFDRDGGRSFIVSIINASNSDPQYEPKKNIDMGPLLVWSLLDESENPQVLIVFRSFVPVGFALFSTNSLGLTRSDFLFVLRGNSRASDELLDRIKEVQYGFYN